MGQTARGFPYPEPSDPVAQGATAIKNLASAIDAAVRRGSAGGRVALTINNSPTGSRAVTFPVGRFTAPPAVVASSETSTWVGSTNAATATGVTVTGRRADGANATGTVYVNWVAIDI